MKKYLLVEHQSGGCDYTIECGTRTSIFEAENMEAALAYILGGDDDGFRINADRRSERCLASAVLHEISATHEIDVRQLGAEREAERRKEEAAATLASKKEQLARLKKELGET